MHGEFIKLQKETMAALIKIREDIENKVMHKGKNYEIVFQAYTEIKKHYGLPKPSSGCRSGCIVKINNTLINWLIQYDKSGINIYSNNKGSNELLPIQDKIDALSLKSWKELKTLLIDIKGQDYYDSLNQGRNVKSKILMKEIIKHG